MTTRVSSPPQSRSSTCGDLGSARLPDHQRHELERAEHALQERQLHLERVFLRVRRGVDLHLAPGRASAPARRGSSSTWPSGVVKADASGSASPRTATRCWARAARRAGSAAQGCKQGVGLRRDGARIDVAGMGHHEHFWRSRIPCVHRSAKQAVNLTGQRARIAGIEQPSHSSRPATNPHHRSSSI